MSASATEIKFEWDQPTETYGSDITAYLVEQRKVGDNNWDELKNELMPTLEATTTLVDAGVNYEF